MPQAHSVLMWEYGAIAVACLGIAIASFMVRPVFRRRGLLAIALSVTGIWSLLQLQGAGSASSGYESWGSIFDVAKVAAWLFFLGSTLRETAHDWFAQRLSRVILGPALILAGFAGLVTAVHSLTERPLLSANLVALALLGVTLLMALAVVSLIDVVSLLQVRRRPVLIGVGLIAIADAAGLSHIALGGDPQAALIARGLVVAMGVVLIGMGIRRRPAWPHEASNNRQATVYVVAVLLIGAYFLVTAAIALFAAAADSRWGVAVGSILVIIYLGMFAYTLVTVSLRRRIKIFIAKHVFRRRYDYRKEWLRLIETLVGRTDDAPLRVRAVRALAEIVGSAAGQLWLESAPGSDFQGYGGWGTSAPDKPILATDALATYLSRSHWVVDTREYAVNPGIYDHALGTGEGIVQQESIFVPVTYRDRLIGIVRLDRPEGLGELSFEDHDLLKTAAQQTAVLIAHEQAQEELLQTRQFEAFSKLTAFLMHDLKNMIAQQDLVVSNARRFRHRPEFIDDAISTIAASVDRMRKILERLQSSTHVERTAKIELQSALLTVCAQCSDRRPVPEFDHEGRTLVVEISRERFIMAMTHLIRNAQDATPPDGTIRVKLTEANRCAVVEVTDTGCGMEADFIKSRLFRPFDSTKGAQGMGIGAFQIRETLLAVGGRIDVESQPERGTTMRVTLPTVQSRQRTKSEQTTFL